MKVIKSITILAMAMLVMSASSCKDEKYPDLGDGLYAELITNKGIMVAELFYDKTPVTVANFVALAEGTHPQVSDEYKGKPFYNGLTFHRVMDQFMIQGGDPTASGSGNPGFRFPSELDITLKHDKAGILSMANSGGLNTNGSQFFITEVPYPSLDGYDANGNLKPCDQPRVSCHTVFGELVMGIDVQDSISNVEVAAGNKPVEDVVIQELNIIRQGSSANNFNAVKVWETELPKLQENLKKQEEEARKKIEEQQRIAKEKTDKAAAEVLPKFNEYKGKAKKSSTGLMTYTITQGSGPKVKQGQNVTVYYEGYFTDGRLLDSNRRELEEKYGMLNPQKEQRGLYDPMPMAVSPDAQLIAGFKEAIANMSVGEKVFVYIPSHLAYGESGRGSIQPNTDLIFILELVAIAN